MTKTMRLCYNTRQTVSYTLQLRYLLFSDVEKDIITIVQLATYQRSAIVLATDGVERRLILCMSRI